MKTTELKYFNSIEELQNSIKNELEYTKNDIEKLSKTIGEKLRLEEDENSEYVKELQEKLNLGKKSNDKKSSKASKKSKKSKGEAQWLEHEGLHCFNGMSAQGEIELHFRTLENLKEKAEKLDNAIETINQFIDKGLKRDLAGVQRISNDHTIEIAFISQDKTKKKFAYKSIITLGAEPVNYIVV